MKGKTRFHDVAVMSLLVVTLLATVVVSLDLGSARMDREHGAREACEFVKKLDFEPSAVVFDAAFADK